MPESRLMPASALGTLAKPGSRKATGVPGITIAERTGVSICSVLARKGSQAELAERVLQTFGIELPRTPRIIVHGPVAFVWAGRAQWLALQNEGGGPGLEQRLRSSLAGVASVMDQSDGRKIVRIGGPRARDALTKGVLIDLHPTVFRPGHTAITAISHIGVHFWQIDTVPTYEVAMFRSFAIAFWEWVVDAAAEFGVFVE